MVDGGRSTAREERDNGTDFSGFTARAACVLPGVILRAVFTTLRTRYAPRMTKRI